jgi:alginate O-acetyltransferase complex protein AlgI
MLFSSLEFAIFFPITYALYLVLPHIWQNRMLLIASYIFYGAWEWRYLFLILISTCVDYLCGIGIEESSQQKRKKALLTVSIVVNLSMLCIFKYYDFFAKNFEILLAQFGLSVQPYYLNVALPIGISFYTFQTMSYTIDVYRRKVTPTKNFFDFALYVSFFPQLIAGPIERGTRLLPQVLNPRTVNWDTFYRGGYFIFWGLFLKVFMADNLAKIVDPVFQATGPYNGTSVLLATYAFSFQIYCDFAGYSFMAIGLALVMGIDLMENFRRPYFSKNIGEFWRRWHISLSSWFRDYMFSPFYIYLSGLRFFKNFSLKTRHGIVFFIALLITEFLLGMWHGAGWNFGLFGIYHGIMIGLYYFVNKYWDRMNEYVQILLTFQLAAFGWLIFRSQSLQQTIEMINSLFINFQLLPGIETVWIFLEILSYIIILILVQIYQERTNNTLIVLNLPSFWKFSFFLLLGILIMLKGDFNERPFIYFQF